MGLFTNSFPQKISRKQSWSARDLKQIEAPGASPNRFSFNVRSSHSNKDDSNDIDFGIFNKRIDFDSPYLPKPKLLQISQDSMANIEEDIRIVKKDYDEFCDPDSSPKLRSPPRRGSYPCERGQVIKPAYKENFSSIKIGDVIFFPLTLTLELWLSA